MFPKKHQVHNMEKRVNEKFVIRRTFTERHRKSAIPHMQRLLNKVETEQRKICKQIDNFIPVTSRLYYLIFITEILKSSIIIIIMKN